MVILKKIRAATLVESMIASVIIVVVFLIASLSLNNVFKSTVRFNDSNLQNRVKELRYLINNDKTTIPFYEENEQWDIAVEREKNQLKLSVLNKKTSKTKTFIIAYEAY